LRVRAGLRSGGTPLALFPAHQGAEGTTCPKSGRPDSQAANRSGSFPGLSKEEAAVLRWALIFLVVALIAAVLGFGGIAGGAAEIAKILFYLFLVIFVISLILGLVRRA
jgi:uncharacterized membrane protein YtjA (UPF0391 family)